MSFFVLFISSVLCVFIRLHFNFFHAGGYILNSKYLDGYFDGKCRILTSSTFNSFWLNMALEARLFNDLQVILRVANRGFRRETKD